MTKPYVRIPRAALSGFFFLAYGLFARPSAIAACIAEAILPPSGSIAQV